MKSLFICLIGVLSCAICLGKPVQIEAGVWEKLLVTIDDEFTQDEHSMWVIKGKTEFDFEGVAFMINFAEVGKSSINGHEFIIFLSESQAIEALTHTSVVTFKRRHPVYVVLDATISFVGFDGVPSLWLTADAQRASDRRLALLEFHVEARTSNHKQVTFLGGSANGTEPSRIERNLYIFEESIDSIIHLVEANMPFVFVSDTAEKKSAYAKPTLSNINGMVGQLFLNPCNVLGEGEYYEEGFLDAESFQSFTDADVMDNLQRMPTHPVFLRIATVSKNWMLTWILADRQCYSSFKQACDPEDERSFHRAGDWEVGTATIKGEKYDIVHWSDIDDSSFTWVFRPNSQLGSDLCWYVYEN